MDFGLHYCQTDHSVFYLNTDVGYLLIIVYIDEIIITRDDYLGILD